MSVFGPGRAYGMDTPRGEDWRTSAVCRDEDPALFFPLGDGGDRTGASLDQEEEAKRVCGRCPVAEACLEFALTWVPDGIAGGMNEAERRKIRQERKIAPARTSVKVVMPPRLVCYRGLHQMVGDNVRITNRKRKGQIEQIRSCKACRDAWFADGGQPTSRVDRRAAQTARMAVAA